MTVSSTTNRKEYAGDGVTTSFDTNPVVFFETSNLRVSVVDDSTGAETLLTEDTDYSVTGGDGATGTVDLSDGSSPHGALATGTTLVILRVLPLTQTDDYVNNSITDAEVVEDRIDRITMILQQLNEIGDRTVRLSEAEAGASDLTVLPFNRASKFLAFDEDKNMIAAEGESGAPTSVFVATLLDDVDADAFLTTLFDTATIDTFLSDILFADADLDAFVELLADGATAETSPAAGDKVLISDASANDGRVMTLENVLKVVGSLTEATEVDGENDKLLIYDNSAAAARYADAQTFLRKNAIINGDFNVWQRGTSFTSVANGDYTADRWFYNKVGAMVHDISRSTDVPTVAQAGRLFNYSILVDCQTVDSSIAASDNCVIRQSIEGYNFLPLAQRAITLSFWVKATKTGIYCVGLRNSGNDRQYTAEYTVNASDTWEKKTVTIAASPSAGTWDYTTGIGLVVGFVLAAGSTYHSTAGTWQAGSNLFATANQVNACDSTDNNFRLCGVQLEAGSVATPFEVRPYSTELSLCQRYLPAFNSDGTAHGLFAASINSSTGATMTMPFAVRPRATPTGITVSNVTHVSVSYAGSNIACTNVTFNAASSIHAGLLSLTVASGLTAGGAAATFFNNAAGQILFTGCEL